MSDLIDRQQALDALYHVDEYNGRSVEAIRNLPSAQPRMKGRWIKQVDESINAWWYECSACGDYPLKDAFGHDSLSQFCPWCGAEMSEGEEDE